MKSEVDALQLREREVAAAKSHNRKIVYTLLAIAVSSLVMAVARL